VRVVHRTSLKAQRWRKINSLTLVSSGIYISTIKEHLLNSVKFLLKFLVLKFRFLNFLVFSSKLLFVVSFKFQNKLFLDLFLFSKDLKSKIFKRVSHFSYFDSKFWCESHVFLFPSHRIQIFIIKIFQMFPCFRLWVTSVF